MDGGTQRGGGGREGVGRERERGPGIIALVNATVADRPDLPGVISPDTGVRDRQPVVDFRPRHNLTTSVQQKQSPQPHPTQILQLSSHPQATTKPIRASLRLHGPPATSYTSEAITLCDRPTPAPQQYTTAAHQVIPLPWQR